MYIFLSKKQIAKRAFAMACVSAILVAGVVRFAVNERLVAMVTPWLGHPTAPAVASAVKYTVREEKTEYVYHAYNGDSVISLSRFAVANYLAEIGWVMDSAESAYVEDEIARDFGYKRLMRGEEIVFERARIAELVVRAKNLSASERISWAK